MGLYQHGSIFGLRLRQPSPVANKRSGAMTDKKGKGIPMEKDE
jgi:hypothetical protein